MKVKDKIIKLVTEISRFILGITFLFSGFVKAVDPMGSAYKIQDYLIAFGLDSLTSLALPVSIALCVLEFTLGAFMFLGIYRRIASILMLIVMVFMTILTLYLAIANPVSDCGCFGDFLIITNWQTFYKNIVLLLCSLITFLYFYRITNFFTGKFYWIIGIFTIFYILSFSIYNSYYEPIFDFRPYKIGANLAELTSVEDGKGDVYENIFVYEKDREKKEFTEQNYPWQDSTWRFVEMTTKLVKEGDKAEIVDFKISELFFNQDKTEVEYEDDITNTILADTGYVFLMNAYSLENANVAFLSKFEDIQNYANDRHYKFYCLTASTTDQIIEWENINTFNFTYCHVDERVLKTMSRSNPSLLLLKDGVVINKWSGAKTPKENILNKPLNELNIDKTEIVHSSNNRKLRMILLLFSIPLIGIKIFDFFIYQRRKMID